MNTVLGHYPAYLTLAARLGASYFNLPESRWNGMTNRQRWAAMPMPNSFANRMEECLAGLGRGKPLLVECLHDEANFGNAQAIFDLGGLRLHFLNDRGLESVDIEIADGHGGSAVVPLENLAVAASWLNLKELLCHYGLSDSVADSRLESDPPPGPFLAMDGALNLIDREWDRLIELCASGEMLGSVAEVQKLIRDRMGASLSRQHSKTQQ
ncbi:MAG: hypothetical protein OXF03_09470 [Gammaproteobacteria bacterium]|nr:hypothetical protein [Gammaproteobacteria bacterium]